MNGKVASIHCKLGPPEPSTILLFIGCLHVFLSGLKIEIKEHKVMYIE